MIVSRAFSLLTLLVVVQALAWVPCSSAKFVKSTQTEL